MHNVGIIGLGHVATHQIAAIASSPDFRLRAGCDPDTSRHSVLGGAATAYTDANRLLEHPDLDVVVVASPNRLHVSHGAQVMAAGKWLFIEKPLAETREEFEKFERYRQEYGGRCTLALHAAFGVELEWYCKMHTTEGVDASTICSFEAEFFDPYIENGRVQSRAASLGGSWIDSGINALSVICRLIGPGNLVVRGSQMERVNELACTEVQGSVEFEILRPNASGTGRILTSWTAGRDQKRTTIFLDNGDSEIVLDHSAQRVVLKKDGQDQVLFQCENDLPRLTNHYVGAFNDLAAQMNAGEDNFGYGRKLHEFLYQAEKLAR